MSSAEEQFEAGWEGRNATKDVLRHKVWQQLADSGDARDPGGPFHKIPDFEGASAAVERLRQLPMWKNAKVVKSNPDPPQAFLRKAALEDGKKVYTPVPCLTHDFPFLLLDPEELFQKKNLKAEDVMYSEGAMEHGKRVDFKDMEEMDICVVGSVAVTPSGGRTGKGGGFADLELGIFRHYGTFRSGVTPCVTIVHPVQVVDNDEIVMEEHDTPLDYIVTAERIIETKTQYSQPGPLQWDKLQPDQYENIPFLKTLRLELE